MVASTLLLSGQYGLDFLSKEVYQFTLMGYMLPSVVP